MNNDRNQVEIAINNPGRVLHFSDGVDEVMEETMVDGVEASPAEDTTDPSSLQWGLWFSYYAWKSGGKVLNAVDYAGESLASFFGITTPKYQIEIDEYERLQAEKKRIEEESAGWVPKNDRGNVPLVLSEPKKVEPVDV